MLTGAYWWPIAHTDGTTEALLVIGTRSEFYPRTTSDLKYCSRKLTYRPIDRTETVAICV
jgi:hypothetical protein